MTFLLTQPVAASNIARTAKPQCAAVYTVTWVPISTTRPVGIWK